MKRRGFLALMVALPLAPWVRPKPTHYYVFRRGHLWGPFYRYTGSADGFIRREGEDDGDTYHKKIVVESPHVYFDRETGGKA